MLPKLHFQIALFLLLCMAAGCSSTRPKQLYENSESGISLEKPENWDVAYYERSGVIVLEAEEGSGNKDSARIEIHGSACIPTPAWFDGSQKEIESNIERISTLHNLDSVTIIQEPTEVELEHHGAIKAIIAIPTMSLPEDSVENQVGDRGPDIFQTIEMFAISDRDKFILVYLYEGNSEEINAEAEEIITGIQLICSTEP